MLNTFPASLTVHGGDVLGVWNWAGLFENALFTGGENDTVAFALSVSPPPAARDHLSTHPRNTPPPPLPPPPGPPPPPQMVTDLQTTVSGLGLPKGTANALNSSLAEASAALARRNGTAACNALNAFLNKVQAQTGKKLTPDQADELTSAANQIRAQLGC